MIEPREFLNGRVRLFHGDCREVLRGLADNSVDSVVTDPPYHLTSINKRYSTSKSNLEQPVDKKLENINAGAFKRLASGFMGKQWDGGDIAFQVELWAEVLRVLKPGGYICAFGGSRTWHRMACAIEDAGFITHPMIAWIFGSGFPKAHSVSRQWGSKEEKKWLNVIKDIDNLDEKSISEVWKKHLNIASNADSEFQKRATEAGMNTPKSVFALGVVEVSIIHKSLPANAVLAEMNSSGAHHTFAGLSSVHTHADDSLMEVLNPHALIVAQSAGGRDLSQNINVCSVLLSVPLSPCGNTSQMTAAVEALMIWLGSKPSSKLADTNALCAALTDALKRIILNQSATFRNYDIKSQTDCVSAINVTITESTAENLISFTANILRAEASERALGAKREYFDDPKWLDKYPKGPGGGEPSPMAAQAARGGKIQTSNPATDAAREWDGWFYGTQSLKPAIEPIYLGQKPFSEKTGAANVLRWGTGALNIGASRINASDQHPGSTSQGDVRNNHAGSMPCTYSSPTGPREPHNEHNHNQVSCEVQQDGNNPPVPNGHAHGHDYSQSLSSAVDCRLSSHSDDEHSHREQEAFQASSPQQDDVGELGDRQSTQQHILDHLSTPLDIHSAPDIKHQGRWPANVVTDGSDEVLACFPETGASPPIGSMGGGSNKHSIFGEFTGERHENGFGDSGSAARFFKSCSITQDDLQWRGAVSANRLVYSSKADADDRLGSSHPTVKPLDLIQYLVRLITPPRGTVLDLFAGTGTTGEAAYREGFNAILIEREDEYIKDIERRMGLVLGGPDERKYAGIKARGREQDAGPLFGSITE